MDFRTDLSSFIPSAAQGECHRPMDLRYGETGAPVNPSSAYLTMKALFRRAGLYSASK